MMAGLFYRIGRFSIGQRTAITSPALLLEFLSALLVALLFFALLLGDGFLGSHQVGQDVEWYFNGLSSPILFRLTQITVQTSPIFLA